MSPVSRQAKLVHILGYVDRQRELVSSEDESDESQSTVIEEASMMVMNKGGRLVPANSESHINNNMEQSMSPLSAPQRRRESKQLYTSQRSVPDALDPCLALPRALPRKMHSSSDLNLYKDSVYFGADIENKFDYSYGTKRHAQVYDSAPIPDWHQDRLQFQRSPRRLNAYARPIVFRAQTEEEFNLKRRPLMRQPTAQSMERSNKPGRLGGFSSFLNKKRGQSLRRQGSHHTLQMKNYFEDSDSTHSKEQLPLQSISYKSGRLWKATFMSASGESSESQSDDVKPRSTVKQMFLDVFKKSSNKPGPEAASGNSREEELHPDFEFESYEDQERELFNLWSPPQVIEAQDDDEEEESSSSDQSPQTIQSPWTPDSPPSSSTTLRNSASFNRLFPYLDDCSKAEESASYEADNEKNAQPSDQLVPIANLIRELATFGLDYVNRNPCSSQRIIQHEQTNDYQGAGNYEVAAM
ncbi:hypothetical protein BGZ49_000555 [Haplosporangium sp. Z 27]|nr:hypothetical protein BGZ49_000555 [Haplosporangium sp. Z 27]